MAQAKIAIGYLQDTQDYNKSQKLIPEITQDIDTYINNALLNASKSGSFDLLEQAATNMGYFIGKATRIYGAAVNQTNRI